MWFYVNIIFGMHLICINCRLNVERQCLMMDTISSAIENPKAARASFQHLKYILITYLMLLSSIYSLVVIMDSNESLEIYALIIDIWSLRSIWE